MVFPNTSGNVSESTAIDYISKHWQELPPHVREAIVTLVDSVVSLDEKEQSGNPESGKLECQNSQQNGACVTCRSCNAGGLNRSPST